MISILFSNYLYSQKLSVTISTSTNSQASLFLISGEKLTFIDSLKSLQNIIEFHIDSEKGFYRIVFDKNKYFNFVYDEEDIEIITDANNILDSLKILKSESNKIYYEFLKLNKDYKTKSELLQLILIRYPKDDDFYQTTKFKLKQIQEEYNYFVNVTSQESPISFIAKYVKSAQLPIIDSEIPTEKQLDFLKTHSLDKVDFNNAELVNSDVFTNKSIEYLTYYRNPQLPKELLEKEFTKAVDTLLNKAKVNQLVYQHITEYLIDGFKKFGFDKIIDYILENYVIKDDLCLDEQTENSIQKRIDQSKLLAIGTKVPNFILNDENGNEINLSQIESEKILLVFYSSQCPHCQELLPQLNELAKSKKEKDLQVLAISFDTTKTDWLHFIKNNKLQNLINLSDLNGWNSKIAKNYFIYATPTMFLIDSGRKILGKPIMYKELVKQLN
ncbi:MAG: redoxin domain-containing protein [Melioribacteraceae bacterium]